MLLIILSLIDIVAGFALSLCELLPYNGSSFIWFLGAFLALKGVWSILTAAAANFYFDIIGILDLVAGVLLIITTTGLVAHLFVYVGIALILKGVYSLIMGITAGG
jgi:hypothetical protein